MSYSAEAPPEGANEEFLREEERALVLAANAGFVDAVAGRLRGYVEGRIVSPRVIFDVGVAALHGAERNVSKPDTRHVDTIGVVIADSAIAEPVNYLYDPVSDDQMAVLLESRLSETTKNPLISLLLSKGALSRSLKQELQISIPDEAYDTFLADLNEGLEGDDDSVDGGVGLLDPRKTEEHGVSALINAKTFDELNEAHKNHSKSGSSEIDSLFNQLAAMNILDAEVSFEESIKFYDNLKRVEAEDGGEEESDAMAQLHLALDIKFLRRAEKFADPQGDYSLLANLIKNYQLKTDFEHENSEELRQRLDYFVGIAFGRQFSNVKPEDLLTSEVPADLRSTEQRLHEDAIERGDYRQVELDLIALSSEESPAELKELYAEVLKLADDEVMAKQIFIATVLEKLNNEKSSHTALSDLASVRTMVDSPELKAEIAKVHDIRILRHAKKMYDDDDLDDRYARVYNFLTSTKFLLEDGHPIVEQGKLLFINSFNKYNGIDDVAK